MKQGLRLTFLALAACARPETPPASEASTAPVAFACAGNSEVTAFYSGDSAVVALPGGKVLTLPHVVSGSGARYSDGTTTWWTKGDSGFVMTGDSVTIADCGAKP